MELMENMSIYERTPLLGESPEDNNMADTALPVPVVVGHELDTSKTTASASYDGKTLEDSKNATSDSGSDVDGDSKQLRSDTYAEGGLTKFYEPIPEYEGRHRWDPHAEWTEAEETRLVRKVCC